MSGQSVQLSVIARARIWAAPQLLQLRDIARDVAEDIPLLTRIASHIGLLLLMVLTIAATGVQLNIGNDKGGPTIVAESDPSNLIVLPDIPSIDSGDLVAAPAAALPITTAPKRIRRDVVKYTVQPGDTVSDIAGEFQITPDSVLWANGKLEDNPDMLSVGQVLNIPPVSGVLVTVQNGESIKSIANKYATKKVSSDTLVKNIIELEFNQQFHDLQAANHPLTTGQFLMVPDGTKPYVPRQVTAYSGAVPATAARGTGNFGWPVSGRITQKYWTRHTGIDVGAATGTPIYAADSGYVVQAGWSNIGYGNMILINHGNGFLTRYGHLSAFAVEVGDSVKKGKLIGRVGNTGNSTGPHLHFEIIRNGIHLNPFGYLR
ncbi:MAG: M23 family metallopeptidase [Chloroflexi bacterium]|nr:M23 family metallopeptidase [Chloroflexota bacterium]